MTHPAALEKMLAVRAALHAAPHPRPRFDLRHLDDVLRAYAAERGHSRELWDRSFADWEGRHRTLLPLLLDLLASVRHRQDHVPRDGDILLKGPALGLLHARFPQAVPDPVRLLQAVEEQYQQENALWAHHQADRPLYSVGRVDGSNGRRDLVYDHAAEAMQDFLHADRPGHRMRLHLYPDGRPAQLMPVHNLLAQAHSAMSSDLLLAYQALWLRSRLTQDAPGLFTADADDDPARQRWSMAAADWYLTFGSPLTQTIIDTAVEHDEYQRAGMTAPVLSRSRPARADELPAVGPFAGPAPMDALQLTEYWAARTRQALNSAAAADTRDTTELADAYRLLQPLAQSTPLNEARQATEALLNELTLRSQDANRLWALKAPLTDDLALGEAEATANPHTAPVKLDPDRERMIRAAEAEARALTAAQYHPSNPASPDAEAHDIALAPPPDLNALRHDPYGAAWRQTHPRAARAYTTSALEAARPDTHPARAEAAATLHQLRTARRQALHVMLGRLHAHRPDLPPDPPAARHVTTRGEELQRSADRAAVLAAFPTTHDAHLCLHGMIISLDEQLWATQENLQRASNPDSSDARLASAAQHERAAEIRALIEVARQLEQLAPASTPTSTYDRIYAEAALIRSPAQPESHATRQQTEPTPLHTHRRQGPQH
ncbi:hypothetical protein AB0K02_23365 [Streptomyces sp. NPDC049597]|uniref:hypothetical protein n=1 Tax=Streptomyces sp. NPDC049597 TaxID=3155276 RepID=UPI0034245E3A